MSSIEILVATHKKQDLLLPDHCRFIQVNAEKNGQWDGYLHDNDKEDNISFKNSSYCELTALYSQWKTSSADIVGLFHYRRFLTGDDKLSLHKECDSYCDKEHIRQSIITEERIEELLKKYDVIVSVPREPFPLTAFEDLQKFVYIEDIWKLIDLITSDYPEYENDLWRILNSTNISYCNMFISGKQFEDEYCNWLFPLLEKLESKIAFEEYDNNHKRIFGYYAEVLLNLYILHNRKKAKEVYRVDLLEGNRLQKYKYKIKNKINHTLSHAGIYPLGNQRQLYKARYDICKGSTTLLQEFLPEMTPEEALEKAEKYLKNTGGSDIKEERTDDYYKIEGTYFSSKLVIFICRKKDAFQMISEAAYLLKKQDMAFGTVNAVRIISSDAVEKKEADRLLRVGISVA